MRKTLFIFLFWRIGLFLLGLGAIKVLPFKPRFPYHEAVLAQLSSKQFIWHWANFDGPHYITIAEKGYIGTGLIQAFFPLYPILMRFLDKIVGNLLYSGLIISNFCFLLGVFFFQKLIKLEKIKEEKWPLLFLLFFPTSFYFASLYSESLFFLLVILSFLFIKQKKWLKAAVFAGLASATRLVGIFIAPALVWEFYQSSSEKNKQRMLFYLKTFFLSLLSFSGLIFFCLYLNKNFHDPFYFAKVQNAFGASRQTDKIILFHQVVWRYLKMMVSVKKNDILFYTVSQEFFLSLLVLMALIWAWIKKMKKSYLIYSFFSFFLPSLTGNLSSMPRYVNLIFPLYFVLARIKNKKIKLLLLLTSFLLLVVNTALFLRGFWIA
jgi:Gpi18-like mannosyltransferase